MSVTKTIYHRKRLWCKDHHGARQGRTDPGNDAFSSYPMRGALVPSLTSKRPYLYRLLTKQPTHKPQSSPQPGCGKNTESIICDMDCLLSPGQTRQWVPIMALMAPTPKVGVCPSCGNSRINALLDNVLEKFIIGVSIYGNGRLTLSLAYRYRYVPTLT